MISIISLSVIYNLINVLSKNFYYVCVGDIKSILIPIGRYDNYYPLNDLYKGYLMVIVCIIIFVLYNFL